MVVRADLYPDQKRRLERLQESLKDQGLSGLMVTQTDNRRYLSGFKPADPQLNESAGFLIVGGSLALLGTDPRYEIEARREACGYTPFIYDKGLEGCWSRIAGLLQGMNRLGFETDGLTYQFYQRLKKIIRKSKASIQLTPTQNLVEGIRARKDPGEIKAIRRSLAVTEAVFLEMAATLRPGQTERAIAWKIKTLIHQGGGRGSPLSRLWLPDPIPANPMPNPPTGRFKKANPSFLTLAPKSTDIVRTSPERFFWAGPTTVSGKYTGWSVWPRKKRKKGYGPG